MGSKRYDRERLNVETALEAVGIFRQKGIHKTEQLHDPLVLAKIFVSWRTPYVTDASVK